MRKNYIVTLTADERGHLLERIKKGTIAARTQTRAHRVIGRGSSGVGLRGGGLRWLLRRGRAARSRCIAVCAARKSVGPLSIIVSSRTISAQARSSAMLVRVRVASIAWSR